MALDPWKRFLHSIFFDILAIQMLRLFPPLAKIVFSIRSPHQFSLLCAGGLEHGGCLPYPSSGG